MNKRRLVVMGTVIMALLGVCAWAFGFFKRTDPKIAELQQISEQLQDKNLSDAQRNQLRDDIRQRLQAMPDDQRRAYFDASRERWTGYAQQRMDEFFKMSKADQQKRLDEILDRIAKGNNSQRANQSNRGNRANMTDAQREERSKKRLDRTSPTMRAQFSEFRKRLDDRAQQRGINLGDQRGWGYGGGFGGGRRG